MIACKYLLLLMIMDLKVDKQSSVSINTDFQLSPRSPALFAGIFRFPWYPSPTTIGENGQKHHPLSTKACPPYVNDE